MNSSYNWEDKNVMSKEKRPESRFFREDQELFLGFL